MSFSTRHGGGQPSDQEFERALIDSARADELPEARAAEAWSAFAQKLTGAAGAVPGMAGSAAAPRAAGPPVTAAVRSGYGAATRWLLVGALGGGAVAAGLMWRHRSESASGPTGGAVVSAGASEEPLAERPDRARIARAEPAEALSPPPYEARRLAAQARRAHEASLASAGSTLAAEVAMLDAARQAGDPDTTLRLIDRYRYEFPEGELVADAEVVAIEALAAKGEHAEVARRATRFLAQHPNDPHAAEVRRLGR